MTINHIDQLTEWWENAEQGDPRRGDTIIQERGSQYMIKTVAQDWGETADERFTRILSRAPKPKPAWHDAVAVIASADLCERQVWERDGASGWDGTAGDVATTEELRDVTPLIEAKVTDEMVHAALTAHYGVPFTREDRYSDGEQADMHNALIAALGLETK